MCMYIVPLGVLMEDHGLACDVTGICSESHRCMLSFVVCKILAANTCWLTYFSSISPDCYFCINSTFRKFF